VKNNKIKYLVINQLIIWHYRLQNDLLSLLKVIFFNNKNLLNAKRILVFRTGSLGDSVCALPAINTIRNNFPEAQIDILTNAGTENLVSLSAIIDKSMLNEIIDYLKIDKKDIFKILKKNKYDLFIQLPQYEATWFRQIRDIFVAKALGVKYAFGWQVASTRFLAKQQVKFIEFENERHRLLGILERNGLRSFGMIYPLGIEDEVKNRIAKEVRKIEDVILSEVEGESSEVKKIISLEDLDNNIGMVVGAKRPQNRWPIEYFKEVAKYLLENKKNILLFGGPEDFELSRQIEGDKVYNYCGKLTVFETAEMMKYCKLVISNDTGPMHLAYAVGTPLIAIFSSRDYASKWYPPNENFIFRENKRLCTKCLDICIDKNACLYSIKPAQIINAIELHKFNI
jgi:ADP-heptose:LPS heptosyltransferase